MKNKDALEEAIEVLQRYVDGKETSLTKIAAHDAIKRLRRAQQNHIVDVNEKVDARAIEQANRIIRGISEFVMRPDYCPKHTKVKLEEASELLSAEIYRRENHIVDTNEKVDLAYTQRMMVVRMLALKSGCKFGLGKDDNEEWDDEWRNVVYIDLPEGQVSYHIAPHDMHLFNDFPVYEGKWDGKFSGGCIEFIKSIQAQEKPCVDVEWLIDDIEDAISNTNDVDVTSHDLAKAVANHLHYQGHLTPSEKPTHSIPEGYEKKLAELSHECVGAIQCLSVHNEWRRGERDDQDDPKEIGESIDIAVRAMDFLTGLYIKQAMIKAVQGD